MTRLFRPNRATAPRALNPAAHPFTPLRQTPLSNEVNLLSSSPIRQALLLSSMLQPPAQTPRTLYRVLSREGREDDLLNTPRRRSSAQSSIRSGSIRSESVYSEESVDSITSRQRPASLDYSAFKGNNNDDTKQFHPHKEVEVAADLHFQDIDNIDDLNTSLGLSLDVSAGAGADDPINVPMSQQEAVLLNVPGEPIRIISEPVNDIY